MKKISKKILASTLALAMTVAGSVVTFADNEASVMPTPSVKAEYSDTTVTVQVSASGDFTKGFDYGVAFDNEKVKVAGVTLSDEFKAFLDAANGVQQPGTVKDFAYVVIGGTISDENPVTGEPNNTKFDGVVGTVTFTLLDGVKAEDAKFVAVAESAKINDKLTADGVQKTFVQAIADGDIKSDDIPGVTIPTPVAPSPVGGTETAGPGTETAGPGTETAGPGTETAGPGTESQAPQATNGTGTDNKDATTKPADNNKTQAPVAAATTPAAKTNTKKAPGTGDAGVVLPIVAICGAAAAVAVASKKKVED